MDKFKTSKRFIPSNLTKELHFPIIRGVVETKQISFIKSLWRFISFNRKFEIMVNYFLWIEDLQKFILIPARFIYNGASVPKILGMLYSATGVLFLGSGPHDFGYKYGGLFFVEPDTGELEFKELSKKDFDDIFNSLCTLETGMWIATGLARKTLGILGFPAWGNYRKKGYKVTEDFPELFI